MAVSVIICRAVRIDADTPALGLDIDPDGEAITIDAPAVWDEASAWQVALLAVQSRPLEREVVTLEAAAAYYATQKLQRTARDGQ